MPLNGHSYLVAQGWSGKGTGLRQGAISRPLAIPQKRTLAGIGKDRDEAFPFWDHIFSAAAKSIQVKCLSDEEGEGSSTPVDDAGLKRTSTGILSNRRPIDGTPVYSGTSTPDSNESNSTITRISLMSQAKRDAAKRKLYSTFFRGPILGPETIAEEEKRLESLIHEALGEKHHGVESIRVSEQIEVQFADRQVIVDLEVRTKSSKKRKAEEGIEMTEENKEKDSKSARKERKRRKKQEEMEAKETLGKKKKAEKEKPKAADTGSAEAASPKKSKHPKGRWKDGGHSSDCEAEQKRKEKKLSKSLQREQGEGVVNMDFALQEAQRTASKEEPALKLRNERTSRLQDKPIPEEIEQKEKKKKKRRKRHENSNG